MSSPWETLGIEPTGDVKAVRRAYAQLLKAIDPDSDVAGFTALRQARDWAMRLAELHAEAAASPTPVFVLAADEIVRVPFFAQEGAESPAAAPPEGVPPALEPSEEAIRAAHSDAAAAAAPPAPPLDLRQEADFEALQALYAMVFDRTRRISQAEMTALVERVLADPAMQNLDHAAHVERFFIDTIVRGTPRSDPMVEPAIAYFGWDAPDTELHRPQALIWILQRAKDRYFEIELRTQNQRLYRFLRRLRLPRPQGLGGWIDGWVAGAQVEYVLGYLQTYHPTVVTGLNAASVDWWRDCIQHQSEAVFPIGYLYNVRRKAVFSKPVEQAGRATMAGIGPILLLFFFLGAIILGITDDGTSSRHRRYTSAGRAGDTLAKYKPNLIYFDDDLDLLLDRFTNGALSRAELLRVNPRLYDRLLGEWRAAQAQRGSDTHLAFETLAERVGGILSKLMTRVLRDGDEKLVLDYAAYYEARLRWAERAAPEECVALIEGGNSGAGPSDLHDRRYGLLARAIRTGMPPADDVKDTGRYTIPPALLEDAMARARLDRAAFDQALQREGPQPAICNSRIALIDAALVRRDKLGVQLLRGMFGG
ncbi:hypothetical protein ABIC65_003731 [Sphingomonas trueperi]|uniref:hypothetical protein n=1 Tax=Sphingomonas trueperi TaxID=53317 RepID=UPI003399FC47